MATKAQLEQMLAEATARAERAEAEASVMWSARVPRSLRKRVRAVQGESTVQDVTIEALTSWVRIREQEQIDKEAAHVRTRGRRETEPALIEDFVGAAHVHDADTQD